MYGLLARAVRVSSDKLTYRFLLRPEARFHDKSPVTARDVAFSLNILKTKGHPLFQMLLRDLASAEAEGDGVALVRFSPQRSRDVHLFVAGLPVFSQSWWSGRDFQASTLKAPLGSGPYQLGNFEQGQFVAYHRVADYWAADLPVNVGQNNFDRIRYSYYRDRTPAFEDFTAGRLNYHEEYTAKFWALSYDFPAVRDGRVKKVELRNGAPHPIQGWYFNLRRPQFTDRRIRDAINYAFDFEWTNKNIMFSTYKRLTSFFGTPETEAKGKPGPAELKLLDPWRGKVPDEVFGDPWIPPVSDGSGSDRKLLRHANDLLMAAGCTRTGTRLNLPNGQPLAFEFLNSSPVFQPHLEPFQANLRRLGIATTSRIVDAAQYKSRLDSFDFDVMAMALGGSLTPGDDLRNLYSSHAAHTPGSSNMAGIASPAVDALLKVIANAQSRADLDVACRALDRVLRAGRYWVPMWYRNKSLIAYWDVFDRPQVLPKFATGAPGTWWWDAEKAQKIGMKG
ncbi:MAG TPA: extracellular solute-binding protein, partial [Beijerinckiaceae bacterium]|nr:extracellular solute-binding protein [Beijerinckiaceae bacterium]